MSAVTDVANERLPIADGRQTWREVWRISHGHRLKLVAVVFLGIVSAAAGLVAPAAIGHMVDRVQNGTADIATVAGALGIMTAAAVLARWEPPSPSCLPRAAITRCSPNSANNSSNAP